MIKGKGTDEDPILSRWMGFIRMSLMTDKDTGEDHWVIILSDEEDCELYAIALADIDMDDLIEAYYAEGG